MTSQSLLCLSILDISVCVHVFSYINTILNPGTNNRVLTPVHRPHIRSEWEGLRKHDVGFLIAVQAPQEKADDSATFPQEVSVLGLVGLG